MDYENHKYLKKVLIFQNREIDKEIHRLKIHPYAKIEDYIVYVSVRKKQALRN